MDLSNEQKEHIVSKLNELWQWSRICPICTSNNWNVGEKLFEIRELGYDGKNNKTLHPAVLLTCSNCGNMIMINAIRLGFEFE